MQYKQLGDTGLLVSTLCFGAMTFHGGNGLFKFMGGSTQTEADEIIKACLDKGVNFFDTADVYSEGGSEEMLGQSFKNLGIKRKDVVIATKCYGRMGPGYNDMGASRKHIIEAVDESLRRLGTDYIDLYQIHGTDPITPIEETLRALDTLVNQGKVRYVGVSNWAAWKLQRAVDISEFKNLVKFDTLQAYYSLAGRELERELVPMMENSKTGLLVWSPLAGGLLSGKFDRNNQKPENSRRSEFDFPVVDKERAWNIIDMLRPIAKVHNASVAQVALAWLLHKPVVTSVIIGARNLKQLEDNLGAADLKLTDDDMRALDAVSELPPEYPGWMIPFQAMDRTNPNVDRWAGVKEHLDTLTREKVGSAK